MEILGSLEAMFVSCRVDLHNPEEALTRSGWKQEELESIITVIEDLTEKLGSVSSPEAKMQLEHTLQDLLSKRLTLQEAAKAEQAKIAR